MIKSINHWSFPAGTTFRQAAKLAKQYGFAGYEPALSPEGELSMQSTDAEIAALARVAADEGIQLASLASGMYWQFSFTSDDEAVRQQAATTARRHIEAAKLLGVDAILVVPGAVGKGFFGNIDVRYDVAYERAQQAIAALEPHARACGVRIGLENVWNNFLLSPMEYRAFIDSFNSAYVGSYFDIGNALRTGVPQHWIEMLDKRIVRVHAKDFRTSVDTINGFVDLLAGDVNYPKVIAALRAVGYDSFLTAEQIGLGGSAPLNVLARTSAAFDEILAM